MFRRLIILPLTIISFFAISCSVDKRLSSQDESKLSLEKSKLVVDKRYAWIDSNIPVCFSNQYMAFEDIEPVQELLRREYSETGVNFEFLYTCPNESEKAIRIAIYRSDEEVGEICNMKRAWGCAIMGAGKALGRNNYGENVALFLPYGWIERADNINWPAIESAVIHEIGHSLGMKHEHERVDAVIEDKCKKAYPSLKEGVLPETDSINYLTPYDGDSVMHYCRKRPKGGPYLTASDKEGFRMIYGDVQDPNPTDSDFESIEGRWRYANGNSNYVFDILQVDGILLVEGRDLSNPDGVGMTVFDGYYNSSTKTFSFSYVSTSGDNDISVSFEGAVYGRNANILKGTYMRISMGPTGDDTTTVRDFHLIKVTR